MKREMFKLLRYLYKMGVLKQYWVYVDLSPFRPDMFKLKKHSEVTARAAAKTWATTHPFSSVAMHQYPFHINNIHSRCSYVRKPF